MTRGEGRVDEVNTHERRRQLTKDEAKREGCKTKMHVLQKEKKKKNLKTKKERSRATVRRDSTCEEEKRRREEFWVHEKENARLTQRSFS